MKPDLLFRIPEPAKDGRLRPTVVEPTPLTPAAQGTMIVVSWLAPGVLQIDSYTRPKGSKR